MVENRDFLVMLGTENEDYFVRDAGTIARVLVVPCFCGLAWRHAETGDRGERATVIERQREVQAWFRPPYFCLDGASAVGYRPFVWPVTVGGRDQRV